MSLSSPSEVQLVSFYIGEVYAGCACAAVAAYDVILTLDREIELVWRRKVSAVTILYYMLRYVNVAARILWLTGSFQRGIPIECKIVNVISNGAVIVVMSAVAVFSSLRVWAIWDRHWLVLIVILPISLFPPIINIYHFTLEHLSSLTSPEPGPIGGCAWDIALPVYTQQRFATATRSCAVFTDFAIIILTWMRTWSTWQGIKTLSARGGRPRSSFSGLVLRDGTWYFVVLLSLNIIMLVIDQSPQVQWSVPSYFNDTLPAILLCRLILNLRSHDLADQQDSSLPHSANLNSITSIRFAQVSLDNIGAPVATWNDRDHSEDGRASVSSGDVSDVGFAVASLLGKREEVGLDSYEARHGQQDVFQRLRYQPLYRRLPRPGYFALQ